MKYDFEELLRESADSEIVPSPGLDQKIIGRAEGTKRRKKAGIVWRAAAVAAVCIVAVFMVPHIVTPPGQENVPEKKADLPSGNSFTVTAFAKELTRKGKVFSTDCTSFGGSICGGDDGDISFLFRFPLSCEGKNIDRITYSLKEGDFMVQKTGHEYKLCKSFSLGYEEQKDKDREVNILTYKKDWSKEKKKKFKALNYDILKATPEQECEAWNLVLGDLGVTCTVTYEDGSTETKEIEITNEVMKATDIGGFAPEDKGRYPVQCYSIK